MRQALVCKFVLLLLFLTVGGYSSAAPLVPNDRYPTGMAPKTAVAPPNWQIAVHKINKMWLAITNGATFGIGFAGSELDPETNLPAPSCEYPANSNITYLYIGALWAGAVVGRDTLVSVGFDGNYYVQEFWPESGEAGAIVRKSNMKTSLDYYSDAVSEQDFICEYTDTITDQSIVATDGYDNRPHIPLGLDVSQRSYGWSYDYAEDFIIFDYTIRNINRFPLKKIYFGIYVDADVYHLSREGNGWVDDICGYVHSVPSQEIPCYRDTIRVAWTADNDGDPNANAGNVFDFTSATSLTGTAVLRSPNPDMQYSFNWWVASGTPSLDWGPRQAGTDEKPFRDFGTGMGSPNGDRNKYYIMSSNEFDYDQLESAVSHTGGGFLPPSREAGDIADGYDARYLFSFGPFDLAPGDTLPLTLAYVAGENFHVNGDDFAQYWDPSIPHNYQDRLSFVDLGTNAKWAHWIFDNPGVDTDGDRDSGTFVWVCQSNGMDLCFNENETPPDSMMPNCKKTYITGDGVPDFRGASPPPAPVLDVAPEFGRLRIRWNGEMSERNIDIFSGTADFEGYRVYYGEDNRTSDYVLVAAYDRDDFNMYTWDPVRQLWNITDAPLERDSLVALFGEGFDPAQYPDADAPYIRGGIYYYFTRQDWNVSDLSRANGIHRVYPDASPNDPSDTTEGGHLRYYEYEYVLDNLLPSKPYWVTVTAFDFGSRKVALSSMESALNLNAVQAYPLPSAGEVEQRGLHVQVYPNPYRIDGGYAAAGFENRDRTKAAERSRLINFYNLPSVCTIRIYSLSGDLVAEIEHNRPDGGPDAQHEGWNLISRNTQAVVSGIYIYQVSSSLGDQLGKLVIIK